MILNVCRVCFLVLSFVFQIMFSSFSEKISFSCFSYDFLYFLYNSKFQTETRIYLFQKQKKRKILFLCFSFHYFKFFHFTKGYVFGARGRETVTW